MSTQPKERPIIFSDEMVRAILAGRKTQTRRIVKPFVMKPPPHHKLPTDVCSLNADPEFQFRNSCPYGQPGERLWLRECWRVSSAHDYLPPCEIPSDVDVEYRASNYGKNIFDGKNRPSIHMPRWASRITLENTGVRIERLQDISAADARAEGIQTPAPTVTNEQFDHDCVVAYRDLWESINGPGSWDANPFVWVVKFRMVENE